MLFYVQKGENLSTYVTPRFGYTRTKAETSGLSGPTVIWGYQGSTSFGVQYALSRRFSVFGEAGVVYSRRHNTSPFILNPVSNAWSSQSGVGVIFYF